MTHFDTMFFLSPQTDASQVVQIKDANGNTITIEKSILKARGIKVPANGQLPPDQLSSIMGKKCFNTFYNGHTKKWIHFIIHIIPKVLVISNKSVHNF